MKFGKQLKEIGPLKKLFSTTHKRESWKSKCLNLFCNGMLNSKKYILIRCYLLFDTCTTFWIEDTHLWRCVIASKYGVEEGGWASNLSRGSHGCSLWPSMRVEWDNFHQGGGVVLLLVVGMCGFIGTFMIGNWSQCPCFWSFFILNSFREMVVV
jgi:hypothetical protein